MSFILSLNSKIGFLWLIFRLLLILGYELELAKYVGRGLVKS